MKKFLLGLICVAVTAAYVYAFSSGIIGATRKNGNGCVCHGTVPSPEVNVEIHGPDTLLANDTTDFEIRISGGPLIRGGTNVASRKGNLIPGPDLRLFNQELTHITPLSPENNTVTFVFKYASPSFQTTDTIFANGNSVDFDGFSIGDKWNFAADKKIYVQPNTQIINLNLISDKYSLLQNYPNPFNPETTIKFSISKSSKVNLIVLNSEGKITDTIINSFLNRGSYEVNWNGKNFPSGVYFYKIITEHFTKTNKMILIK